MKKPANRNPKALAFSLVATLPMLLASECAVLPKLLVVTPADGELRTWMPLDIELSFQPSADATSLQVFLNGNDISTQFVTNNRGGPRLIAAAPKVWGGLVLPGANQITASIQTPEGLETAVSNFTTSGDPYADAVESFTQGSSGGFRSGDLPGIVLGPPVGTGLFIGGEDVVSVGLSVPMMPGGVIALEFQNNVIVDGPGVDFTVFENAFLEKIGNEVSTPFAEPGRVSVSQDGTTWHSFGNCVLTSPGEPPWYPDCAGVRPVLTGSPGATAHASIPTPPGAFEALEGQLSFLVELPEGSGGDSFDLADVPISWARFVRIEAAEFVPGGAVGTDTAGFDLDAVAAVNSADATDANMNGIPDAVE